MIGYDRDILIELKAYNVIFLLRTGSLYYSIVLAGLVRCSMWVVNDPILFTLNNKLSLF